MSFPLSLLVKAVGDTQNRDIRPEVMMSTPSDVRICIGSGIRTTCGIGGGFTLLTSNGYVVYMLPRYVMPVDVAMRYRYDKLSSHHPLEHVCRHTIINGTVLCVCDDSVLSFSTVKTLDDLEQEQKEAAAASKAAKRSTSRRRRQRKRTEASSLEDEFDEADYDWVDSREEEDILDYMEPSEGAEKDTRKDSAKKSKTNNPSYEEDDGPKVELLKEEMLFRLKSSSAPSSSALILQEHNIPTNPSYTPGHPSNAAPDVDDGTKREELMLSKRTLRSTSQLRGKTGRSGSAIRGSGAELSSPSSRSGAAAASYSNAGISTRFVGTSAGVLRDGAQSPGAVSPSSVGTSNTMGVADMVSDNEKLIAIVHGDSVQLMTEPPPYKLSEDTKTRQYSIIELKRVLPEGTTVLATILSCRSIYETGDSTIKRRVLVCVVRCEATTRIVCIDITKPGKGYIVADTEIDDYYAWGDISNDMIVFCSYSRIYFVRVMVSVTSAARVGGQDSSLMSDVTIELNATSEIHYGKNEGPIAAAMTHENGVWMSLGFGPFNYIKYAYAVVVTNKLNLRLFKLPNLTPRPVVTQYSGIPTYSLSLAHALGHDDIFVKKCDISVAKGTNMFLIHAYKQTPLVVVLPLPKYGFNVPLNPMGVLHFPTRIPWHAPPTLYEAAALGTLAQMNGSEHLRDACLAYAIGWDKKFTNSMMPSAKRAGFYEDIKGAYRYLLSPNPSQIPEIIAVGKLHAFLQLTGYEKEAAKLERLYGLDGSEPGNEIDIDTFADNLDAEEEDWEGYEGEDDGIGPILRWE